MPRTLITSAIPYINGIKHLGNLIGSQLPADLYARYRRARGDEVLFLCATDEHGTPAELAAAKAGEPVADYCARMWAVQKDLVDGSRASFDHFGRSSSPGAATPDKACPARRTLVRTAEGLWPFQVQNLRDQQLPILRL